MNPAALATLTAPLKGTEMATVTEIFILLTLLSVGPLILITLTSFTRIVVVLSFLRQAMGTQQAPSNQIIIALALFLTLYVMAPVWKRIETGALTPYLQQQLSAQEAIASAWAPLREFLLRQTRKTDLALFVHLQQEQSQAYLHPPTPTPQPEAGASSSSADVAPTTLIPAYVISELKTAFQIAFLIYVPFLVLDLVVASILMSMGMMFLPPALVSLPFKLVLFVLLDGWSLLIGSLVRSFA